MSLHFRMKIYCSKTFKSRKSIRTNQLKIKEKKYQKFKIVSISEEDDIRTFHKQKVSE